MRRRQRLPEARERVAHAAPFGRELGKPRLELRSHVVERSPELCELVPAPNGDALLEVAVRDSASGRGKPAEVPDDCPPLHVRDDADERQADEQPREEPVARARGGRVDHGLPGQDGKPRRRHSRQRRRDECAITRAAEADRRALPGGYRDTPTERRHRGQDPRSLEQDENVAGGERRALPEMPDESDVERDRRHDLAQAVCAGHDVDGESGGEPRHSPDVEAAGAYDVERRSVGEDPPQRAAVMALERALQRPGARQPLCPCLRAVGLLPVERERHAQPRLLPQGDLARFPGAGNGAEPPVRRRQRDE